MPVHLLAYKAPNQSQGMELSTIDFWYLVREWQGLIGGRIQKIYNKERLLAFQIYAGGKNQQLLLMDNAAFLSEAKLAFPPSPSGYTMFLRKRLQGTRISAIELLGFDRIVKITVSTKDGPLEFIAELFGEANSMLLREGKIVSAMSTHTYRDRVIRGGVAYLPPPSRPAPWDAELSPLLDKPAGKAIAVDLGVGARYSDELCARARLLKNDLITDGAIEILHEVLQELRAKPLHALENGTIALPFSFVSLEGDWRHVQSFNAAVDAVLRSRLETAELAQKEVKQEAQKNKQERIIEAQEKQVRRLEKTIGEDQQRGEAIYQHYATLQAILDSLKKDWKTLSVKEIQAKYTNHPLIKQINADGTFEVELENMQ